MAVFFMFNARTSFYQVAFIKKRNGVTHMKGTFILRAVTILIFIVAMLYLAGLVWTAVRGGETPEGVAFFYPWLPR